MAFSEGSSSNSSTITNKKEFLQEVLDLVSHTEWDPMGGNTQMEIPTPQCLNRIKQDLRRFNKDKPPGIFVLHDETNIMIVHTLIIGPKDTPYEGGFFYFFIKFPPDYPIRPPRVKLLTTGGGRVRFNPNVYQSGKVCLSILGTWVGPAWSPALTLMGVLVSIQSLLNDKPYHNEPGYEAERTPGEVENYNKIIHHETLRVAVCGMVDNDTGIFIPDSFMHIMEAHFVQSYSRYLEMVDARLDLDGQDVKNPFRRVGRGTFQFKAIKAHLERLHARLMAARQKESGENENKIKLTDEMTACCLGNDCGLTLT